MFFPIQVNGNLIIDEGVDFALSDFQGCCSLVFEEQKFDLPKMLIRINVASGPLFDCYGRSWSIYVLY